MKKKLFLKSAIKSCIVIICLITVDLISAQTIPENTRLVQINTLKGSILTILESSESHVYHVGTANSELGFDGYNFSNIGNDDMFILKSNNTDGSNVWMKTFNAGDNGTILPKKVFIDANDNVYIFGQFSGSITIGTKTITSNTTENTFLLKLNSSGIGEWINSFANTDTRYQYLIKMASDANDLFMIYSKNHLVRINKSNGDLIYNKEYSSDLDLRGIATKENNIYVAGFMNSTSGIFGTEEVTSKNGFVLKGDKEANFTASAKMISNATHGADINDIAIDSSGKLLMTGYSNSSSNLATEAGTFTYTYNPNTVFENDKIYYYTVKIDADLGNISFFRTSSAFSYSYNSGILSYLSAKIIPYGNEGRFKLLNHIRNYNLLPEFTNSNESVTSIYSNQPKISTVLTFSDDLGTKTVSTITSAKELLLTTSFETYTVSEINSRLFTTNSYHSVYRNLLWTKQKTSSVGGSLSTGFAKHLNSAPDEMFVSALIEGKANFFGKPVNNITNIKSRHFARLGNDGLPKWTARFTVDSGKRELNLSNDFAAVDKDDNFIFLANSSGVSSTFYDANGQSVDFQQIGNQSSKALIKVDKNGNLLWSKKMSTNNDSFECAVKIDSKGDVYVVGQIVYNVIIDGITISATNGYNLIMLKFDGTTGTILTAKTYPMEGAYSIYPVLNLQDELFIFMEMLQGQSDYNFEGVIIPKSSNSNQLMLKVDSTGKIIWGKNFYANNTTTGSGFLNSVEFDGQDFVTSGTLTRDVGGIFTGLDLQNIPIYYPNSNYFPFMAKISTNGSVIWQKPIHTDGSSIGNYTNVAVDTEKNIYMYYGVPHKIYYDNVEYTFDSLFGNKIIQKFNTDGALQYNIIVDKRDTSFKMIDVFGVDKINAASYTQENNILNYPIKNNNATNFYIATFGKPFTNYLTPEKDYLEVNAAEVPNNPSAAENQFSFNLVNNVNWNATSDKSWLNLSYTNLAGKNAHNTINGTGDAQITLVAEKNNTGATRTSNVIFSGEGVASKTLIITQKATLGTGENNISVITLYPNPAADFLNIKSSQKISRIEIYDMSGKLVQSSKLIDQQTNISNLMKGNYIIKIFTDGEIVTSKFIKK